MGVDTGLGMPLPEQDSAVGTLEAAVAAAQEFNNSIAGAIMEVVRAVNAAKYELGQEKLHAVVAILSAKNQALAEIAAARASLGRVGVGIDNDPDINNTYRYAYPNNTVAIP